MKIWSVECWLHRLPIQKKPTPRTIIVADRYMRVKTIEVGVRAVRCFLNQHPDFTIVFSIGTFMHDTCVFMRKATGRYESVWFNPTRGTRVANVDNFLSHFNMATRKAFHAPDENRSGQCSGYVWNAMTTFIGSDSLNPFDRNDLLVHNGTTKSYEWTKNTIWYKYSKNITLSHTIQRYLIILFSN